MNGKFLRSHCLTLCNSGLLSPNLSCYFIKEICKVQEGFPALRVKAYDMLGWLQLATWPDANVLMTCAAFGIIVSVRRYAGIGVSTYEVGVISRQRGPEQV